MRFILAEVIQMKRYFLIVAAAAALAAGIAIAQGPGYGRGGANAQTGAVNFSDFRVERLTALLGLDESQQQQAKTIFENAQTALEALEPVVLPAQTALQAAVRSGSGIDAAVNALSAVRAKIQFVNASAMSEFYKLLTPAQRDQFDRFHAAGAYLGQRSGAGRGIGRGMGMGPGMGMGRGPWQ
jgi:Spy/CpxP family protein refolding chaperone